MGGGKGSSPDTISAPTIGPNPYEQYLANFAQGIWDTTKPARGYIAADWEKFFNPPQGRQYDPTLLPAFQPLYNMARTGLEDQYGVAKENILSTLPRGGAMGRSLANLETGRAKDIGSLTSQISAPIIGDIYNKAYNAGFVTGPTQAMTGMAGAGGLLNPRLMGQAQLEMNARLANLQAEQAASQGSTMKGAGVGSMLGKGLGAVIPGMGGIGSAISGLGGGKGGGGGSGITSGLGGYSTLMSQAMGGAGGFG